MATCENCGGHVTERYARVFGGNSGELHGCPACRSNSDMMEGAGADPAE